MIYNDDNYVACVLIIFLHKGASVGGLDQLPLAPLAGAWGNCPYKYGSFRNNSSVSSEREWIFTYQTSNFFLPHCALQN